MQRRRAVLAVHRVQLAACCYQGIHAGRVAVQAGQVQGSVAVWACRVQHRVREVWQPKQKTTSSNTAQHSTQHRSLDNRLRVLNAAVKEGSVAPCCAKGAKGTDAARVLVRYRLSYHRTQLWDWAQHIHDVVNSLQGLVPLQWSRTGCALFHICDMWQTAVLTKCCCSDHQHVQLHGCTLLGRTRAVLAASGRLLHAWHSKLAVRDVPLLP